MMFSGRARARAMKGVAFVLLMTAASVVAAETRVALVIGNSEYPWFGKIANPALDAQAVAARLRGLGFDVTERRDLKVADYSAVLADFRQKLGPDVVSVFYYSGHGMQVSGKNFFPGVDAKIGRREDVQYQSLSLAQVFDVLADAQSRANIVFVDAARPSPYIMSALTPEPPGLAAMDVPPGTLLVFSARPGSIFVDENRARGEFAASLLSVVDLPGLPVELMLKRLRADLKQRTDNKQELWTEGGIDGDFFFRPETLATEPVAPSPVQ